MSKFLDLTGLSFFFTNAKEWVISQLEWVISQLENYIPTSQRGVPNGVATLDDNGKVPISQLNSSSINGVSSVNDKTGVVMIYKSDVGLGNVDNTSDENKPVSSATQAALKEKQNKLTAGTNITISGTTISATNTVYSLATTSSNGLMSAADKTNTEIDSLFT